jgi:ubiquinone/menaquinone biosynthesis C-methylase UbiE
LSTDTDWDKWGEIDPYFGVLSSDEYRADNLNEELRAKFFHSGDVYIRRTLDAVRSHLDAGYQPERCVDFGCGVGRLVIPLAGLSREVVGIDVSDHMLAEAASNCEKRNVENVALVKSDDRLTQLDGSFNLIHSCLVLQHIPAKRGMQLIDALVRHLEPGGVVVIQFYYRCDAPKLVRALVKLRYRLPIANTARNLIRGRPLQEPAMQLHTYDLEAILCLLKAAGVASIYLHPFTHDEFQSVTLYGQKSDRHSVSESTTTT